jgi:hypothetical protein
MTTKKRLLLNNDRGISKYTSAVAEYRLAMMELQQWAMLFTRPVARGYKRDKFRV